MNDELFYDSPEDCLKSAVQALGGAKRVASCIWPDKTLDNASRLLLDCLNPSRPEKLDISQIKLIFTMAREAGFHSQFNWFAGEIGYCAKPIVKAEEVDRLISIVERTTATLTGALATLERVQKGAA